MFVRLERVAVAVGVCVAVGEYVYVCECADV